MLLGVAFGQPNLYGPDAPSDVAFLRVVNASPAPVSAVVADGESSELAPGEATEYTPVPGGEARFSVVRSGSDDAEVTTPEAGSEEFLTLLVLEDESRVLRDEVLRDISRGLLVFVNAIDGRPLSLRLGDGTVVFEGVADEPASRTIAEAEDALEVFDPATDEVVGTVPSRTFERGTAHTILVYEGEEGPAVSHLAASLAD